MSEPCSSPWRGDRRTKMLWPSSAREMRSADGTCAVCARPVERALACVDTSTGELLCPVHFRERHFKKVFAQRRVERWSRPPPPEERSFAGLRKLGSDQLTDERLRWAKWRRFVSKRLALRSALESAAEWRLRRNLQKLRAFRSVDRLVVRADLHRVSRCLSTLRCLALWHALSTQEAQRLQWCSACKRAVHRWIAACRLVLLNGIERHVAASLYRIHSCRGALRRLRAHARVRKLEHRRLAPALVALYKRRLLPAWGRWRESTEEEAPFMRLRESLQSLPTSPSGSAVFERRHPRSTLPTDGLAIAARRLLGEELREGAVVSAIAARRLLGEELREGAVVSESAVVSSLQGEERDEGWTAPTAAPSSHVASRVRLGVSRAHDIVSARRHEWLVEHDGAHDGAHDSRVFGAEARAEIDAAARRDHC